MTSLIERYRFYRKHHGRVFSAVLAPTVKQVVGGAVFAGLVMGALL